MTQAVTLVQNEGDTLIDCDHLIDGAGNRFVAFGEFETGTNNTWVTIHRYAPSGAITGEWEVTPTDNHKIDELTLAHSGDVLLVLLTTHEIVSNKPRSIRVESAAIPGVYSVRPGQELEEGGEGAFQPTGEPQEVEVDYDRIAGIIADKIQAAQTTIIANMISKAKIGVEQLFAGGEGSRKVFEQLINTGFSSNMVSLYMLGQWDGLLPNGQPWPHPLTNRPITDEQPWVMP